MEKFRGKIFNEEVFEKYTKKLPSTKENALIKNGLFTNVNKYKAKMTTETDLLSASVALRSAKLGLLTAMYEHEVALHTLAITIGTEYGSITEGGN